MKNHIFKLDPREFKPQIDSIQALSPWPEEHQRDKELIRKAMSDHEKGSYEQRFLLPDGSTGYYFSTFQGIYNDANELIAIRGTVQDITERKLAEGKLRESEEEIRTLLEQLPQKIFHKNAESVYVSCNNNYAEDLGITADEIAGKTDFDFYPKEVAEKYRADDQQVMECGEIEDFEESYNKDGREITVQTIKTPLTDDAGNVTGILGIFWDITQRKRTEAELAATTSFLDTIVDMSPFAMWVSDSEGAIIRTNRSLREALNLTDEQLIGKYNVLTDKNLELTGLLSKVEDVFEKHEPVRFSMPWRVVEAGGNYEGGRDLYIDASFFPILNSEGQLEHVVCQWVDITERKRAEEQIQYERNTAQQYLDVAGVIIVAIDSEGRMILLNQRGCDILRTTQEQALGKSWFDTFVPPKDQERTKQCFLNLMAGKAENIEFFENAVITQDGKELLIAWHNTLLQDDDGRIVGTLSSGEDITERNRAKREREELISKLEAQNAELERFTYTVSHDLKSPLITIQGYVGMLRQDLAEVMSATVDSDLSRISKAADKMDLLLRDLLELSRIGRLVNPPEEVSLEGLTREALELVAGQIMQKGVRVEISPELPVVYGDRIRLLEILQNLIDNAVKYMGDQSQPQVEIGSRVGGEETICYVRDNGMGIDPRYHEKIFGLFEQLDQQAEGSGIGLSLVKRIVEMHGGHIWVESNGPGHGCTVCFTIAAKEESPQHLLCSPQSDTEQAASGAR